jgi:hypothetical protein
MYMQPLFKLQEIGRGSIEASVAAALTQLRRNLLPHAEHFACKDRLHVPIRDGELSDVG